MAVLHVCVLLPCRDAVMELGELANEHLLGIEGMRRCYQGILGQHGMQALLVCYALP
jgi:hypothetical protein